MYILAMDTSNQALGVAIVKNKEVVGEVVTNIAKNHSVRLMPAIEQLMKEVNLKPEQLDKIVVAKGPGSYTGVRIGLTTAKTLAWSLNIPVVGVSSLELLAYRAVFSDALICPFFDARRGLVYTGLYENRQGKLVQIIEEQNTTFADWLDRLAGLDKNVIFLSPDIEKNREIIVEKLGSQAVIPEMAYHIPKPSDLVLAAEDKDIEETHALTPNYLRLAEAEANWLEQQKDKENG
ncbi:tRNA (adenosine(37)-N6)-threonylcarbamoyltransferase complex dimerization subunit type 1 TsaB [Ornithinibacillus massiliensis]|uniref:tRNA (Adenosine(37)-N6)-threonylcarbamoyltransferase complex dimerization subunit type 1 TsaB n=1 Tax=Ornithinibacillus massiliensis TaxID=1944633 RepID=A0ABS5MG04_9BACI|nr:tRNA (adenosine(37)-N6)-threonylcarbamoyltransferase complex dimerization subunit type 1 TsaB [Ornithinibacillus massiliensis]MBS3681261.1 tRNA (adenosine(37)-N6)-threonylcarbamoyltransferase complex dimerization subunit type 1 TsaB [Ornithinibacillus massiliensis]